MYKKSTGIPLDELVALYCPAKATKETNKEPKTECAFWTAQEFGDYLGVDRKEIYRLHDHGKIPLPAPVPSAGRGERPRLKWDKEEVQAWKKAGMPGRREWESRKK